MKKPTITLLATLVASSLSAQGGIMLWDGESHAIGSNGGCWTDGSPTVAANPSQGGINPSSRCLKFTMTEDNKTVKIPFRDWMQPSMGGSRRVSLMIRKATNENVKIELSDPTNSGSNYWYKAAAWYGGSGEWQRVVFDFSAHPTFDYPGVISITAQTGYVGGSQEVFIDNVQIESTPMVNGQPLSAVGYCSLSGHAVLTGLWAKGECSKVNDDNSWQTVRFDDFEPLAARLTARVTSVDMRQANVIGAANVFAGINPNIIIYANEWFAASSIADATNTTNYIETPEYAGMPTYFTPPVGFVGDPMPYYDSNKGEFKIAYLQDYRPNPECFHPIHMITSANLSSFSYQGEAVGCGSAGSQEQSLGTGCIYYDEAKAKYYLFYTGHQGNYAGLPGIERQEELYRATSVDGVNWTKEGFVLKAPSGYDWHQFRDPHIVKEGNTYHIIITAMRNINGTNYPCIAHFTATDLDAVNPAGDANAQHGGWTEQEPLFTDMARANVYQLYECPDLFQIGDRYYLVYSDQRDNRVHYMYRRNLNNTGGDEWTYGGVLDGNGFSFYAGKTAFDGYDRYLFGWCSTSEGPANKDWAGTLVTHKLYRKADGTLGLTVPHTFDEKFRSRTDQSPLSSQGNIAQSGQQYSLGSGSRLQFGRLQRSSKLMLSFKAESNSNEVFGFTVRDNSDNNTRYSFRLNLANQMMYLNRDNKGGGVEELNQVPLPRSADGVYNLRIYQEQSVIVVYVNDQIAFTNRIYNQGRNPWSVFCDSGRVSLKGVQTYSY